MSELAWSIRKTESGFELVEMKPVRIGIFADEATAERVRAALELVDAPPMRTLDLSEPTTTTAEPVVDDKKDGRARQPGAPEPATETPEPARPEAPQPPPAPVKSAKPVLDTGAWSEDELAVAFARIEAGEKIPDIAADLDRSQFVLRAKWSRRPQPVEATPATPEPAAEGPEPARDEAPPAAPKPVLNAGAWTEDEMAMAFARIEAGEKLSDVAEDFGKPMLPLRGKWGAHLRYRREAAPENAERAATPASAEAAPDEDDLEECRRCGKEFRATATRFELCARCDRG